MPFNYLPHTEAERLEMLARIGVASIDDLYQAVPDSLRHFELEIPPSASELEVNRRLSSLAARNVPTSQVNSFLGAGAQRRYAPAAVDWVLHRSEFLTAYTPYQPEVAQGTLQVIYEFQSLICQMTGLDVANASLYDGSTAVPEAAFMAMRITRRPRVLIARDVHPEYREVLATYASGPHADIAEVPLSGGMLDRARLAELLTPEVACLVVQVPSFLGTVQDMHSLAEQVHAAGALLVVVADPTSLGILEAPGAYGADIVVGEAQAFGNAVAFGGPYVGFMACRETFARQMPGRIVGQTLDSRGQRCFTLTMQTREQHIRREKATSNICTNQALNALAATVHMAVLGPTGLRDLGRIGLQRAHALAEKLARLPGFSLAIDAPFFNEFVLRLPADANATTTALAERGILPGVALGHWYPEYADCLLVSVTELNTPEDCDRLVDALADLPATRSVVAR
ncbi:MAG: aminomethyl-transferring glycine dehydrogenase subunit GcvPA [bacterium]|nr:aminomethyl-transferring glycine dehydrogenase subunit GcvPA [bacterium]